MRYLTLLVGVALALGVAQVPAFAQDNPDYDDEPLSYCPEDYPEGYGACGCGGVSILCAAVSPIDIEEFFDDYDEDAVEDSSDNCPRTPNMDQIDRDADQIGDACDNSPEHPNRDQRDQDHDGLADVIDPDRDGDGLANELDACPDAPESTPRDTDADGFGDLCDADADGDGLENPVDPCPLDASITAPTLAQHDVCFADSDGDGHGDFEGDNCPAHANPEQLDRDGDGTGDLCDDDRDGDKVVDLLDLCPDVANAYQEDDDRDGVGDACDDCVDLPENAGCLELRSPALQFLSPGLSTSTGEPVVPVLYGNHRGVPVRYRWRVLAAPDGGDYTWTFAEGVLACAEHYRFRYVDDRAPTFVAFVPGDYVLEAELTPAFDDDLARYGSTTARLVVAVSGDAIEREAEGCQLGGPTPAAIPLGLVLLVGGLAVLAGRRAS